MSPRPDVPENQCFQATIFLYPAVPKPPVSRPQHPQALMSPSLDVPETQCHQAPMSQRRHVPKPCVPTPQCLCTLCPHTPMSPHCAAPIPVPYRQKGSPTRMMRAAEPPHFMQGRGWLQGHGGHLGHQSPTHAGGDTRRGGPRSRPRGSTRSVLGGTGDSAGGTAGSTGRYRG